MFNLSRGRPPFVKRCIQLKLTLLQLLFLRKLHAAQPGFPFVQNGLFLFFFGLRLQDRFAFLFLLRIQVRIDHAADQRADTEAERQVAREVADRCADQHAVHRVIEGILQLRVFVDRQIFLSRAIVVFMQFRDFRGHVSALDLIAFVLFRHVLYFLPSV